MNKAKKLYIFLTYMALLGTSYFYQIIQETNNKKSVTETRKEFILLHNNQNRDDTLKWANILFFYSPEEHKKVEKISKTLNQERDSYSLAYRDGLQFNKKNSNKDLFLLPKDKVDGKQTLLKSIPTHLIINDFTYAMAYYFFLNNPKAISSITLIREINDESITGKNYLFDRMFLSAAIFWENFLYYALPHFGSRDLKLKKYYHLLWKLSSVKNTVVTDKILDIPLLVVEERTLDSKKILHFWEQVENATLQDSSSSQIHSLPVHLLTEVMPFSGMTLLYVCVILALSSWLFEDLSCVVTGFLVAQGLLHLFPAILACFVGIYSGDLLLYGIGRVWGRSLLQTRLFMKLFPVSRQEQISHSFRTQGIKIILISRFIPALRLPVYTIAGVLKIHFGKFNLYTFIAVGLWTPLLVLISIFIGEAMLSLFEDYQYFILLTFSGIIFFWYIFMKGVLPLFHFRGRRILLMRYLRFRHYEFWPTFVFYTPVILYILYLGLKHRCLTLFTIANPAIPASGIRGESKSEILDGLGPSDFVAQYCLLKQSDTNEERINKARDFMEKNDIKFPTILKPDVGERGQSVKKICSTDQLQQYLLQHPEDAILQEYVLGQEFGVLYMRLPQESKGFIFSLATKELITLYGDGKSTLETLILHHPRSLCLAKVHLAKYENDLGTTPPKGVPIPLVEIGTHSRGAIFLDGSQYHTVELENSIDRLSCQYEGFYIGRFDIKTPSIKDFMCGENYKIIELNALTGEPAHMYDPKNSIFKAYAIVMKLWKFAFLVGKQNNELGHKPLSIQKFFATISK